MILVTTGTYAAHYGLALDIGHAVVFAIAASSCQPLDILRLGPTPLLIQLD
jgi:hypothetical protein